MKKKLIVAATAGALTLAASQALAFENQFSGVYKLKYFLSNYENGGSSPIVAAPLYTNGGTQGGAAVTAATSTTGQTAVGATPGAYFTNAIPPKKGAGGANYFEQRARLFYTAKANDSLKLVTGFELDSVFGDRGQSSATRGSGGALEADAVNLETKWVYLDFAIPETPVSVKAGIQPYKDAIKGIFLDADIAGVYTTSKFGAATVGLGYFRPYENAYFNTGYSYSGTTTTNTGDKARGADDLHIAALDASFALNKDLKVGGAYYFYGDYRTQKPMSVNTFALTAEGKAGPATISGFLAYQGGDADVPGWKTQTIEAWAANVAAKVPVGSGTARAAFLVTSGDNDDNNYLSTWNGAMVTQQGQTNLASSAANSYNESGMMLLNRNAAQGGTSTDQNIFYSTGGVLDTNHGNTGLGMTLLTLGYDLNINPKLYLNTNLGFGMNTKSAGNQYVGTEINTEIGYKLYDNLTASVQAAYVALGDYYAKKNDRGLSQVYADYKTPENPYTGRVVLSYAF